MLLELAASSLGCFLDWLLLSWTLSSWIGCLLGWTRLSSDGYDRDRFPPERQRSRSSPCPPTPRRLEAAHPIPPDLANSGEHKWLFRVGISADTIFDDSCPPICAQDWSVDDLCISPSSYRVAHANLSSPTGIGASVRRRGTGHAFGRLPFASISVTCGPSGRPDGPLTRAAIRHRLRDPRAPGCSLMLAAAQIQAARARSRRIWGVLIFVAHSAPSRESTDRTKQRACLIWLAW
jgi:hypothetical protein